MKNTSTLFVTHRWLILLWVILTGSQIVWAQQPIPDAQWAKLGKTLAITTDGNIVTTEQISAPTAFTSLTIFGDKAVKYSLQGDKIWDTGFLKGGFFIGGKIPGYDYEVLGPSILTATTDGGVALAGRTSIRGAGVTEKVAANGAPRPWQDSDIFSYSSETTIDDIIGTPDGGFLMLFTSIQTNAPTKATIRKYDAAGNFSWTRQLAYPVSNPASPDLSLTKGESIINTPDGGFLVVGYYNNTGIIKDLANNTAKTETGWIAKLNG